MPEESVERPRTAAVLVPILAPSMLERFRAWGKAHPWRVWPALCALGCSVGWWISPRQTTEPAPIKLDADVADVETREKLKATQKELAETQGKLRQANEKIQAAKPSRRAIFSAVATVEITLESAVAEEGWFIDRGGYITFGRDGLSMLAASSVESRAARLLGKDMIQYSGVFELSATDPSIGKPISHLKDADACQVMFEKFPENSKVIGGKAIVTINGDFRMEFGVEPQTMAGKVVGIVMDTKALHQIIPQEDSAIKSR